VKKGFAFAVEAVGLLRQAGVDARLTIVGRGPELGRLEAAIARFGLGDAVDLVDWIAHDQIPELMRSHDFLLSPSITDPSGDMEGIPNVLKEAMAVGTPVIATRHSGIPELVVDGETGYLVQERDSRAIARCVQHAVRHPDVLERMRRAAREQVEKQFDSRKLNERLSELLHSLIQ
jgi:colanic acid/amylovoran biosynthesis glycosyltransferase